MEYYSVPKMWDQDGKRHISKQNEIISNGFTLYNSIFSLRKANYGKSEKVWMFQRCGMKGEADGKEICLRKWSYPGFIISWYDQENKWSNNSFFGPKESQNEAGDCTSYEHRVIMVCPMCLGNTYWLEEVHLYVELKTEKTAHVWR